MNKGRFRFTKDTPFQGNEKGKCSIAFFAHDHPTLE